MLRRGGVLLLMMSALLLTGCTAREIVPKSGRYVMSAPAQAVFAPVVSLDAAEETFTFTYDLLSSYLPYGSYAQKDRFISCQTSDGRQCYVFRVVDENTLAFEAERSSAVALIDARLGVAVGDGAVFSRENE